MRRARSLWRRLTRGPGAAMRDPATFWKHLARDMPAVRRALYERYPLVPSAYVDAYLGALAREHAGNPRVLLYLDAELGAPRRQRAVVAEIEAHRGALRGRRCLDVGCSNGALALAAATAGAAAVVGVDVSAARLAAARQLCAGSPVELLQCDFGTEDLPAGSAPFDVILCTDVLEHVRSVAGVVAAVKRWLAAGPQSYAYVSVFNGLHPSCIAAEPHYGVPGLVLLDPGDARDVWHAVRGQVGSALDYEVHAWPRFGALKAAAEEQGLRVEALVDRAAVSGRRLFWRGYQRRLRECERAVHAGLARLTLPPRRSEQIRDAVAAYGRTYIARHEEFAATRPQPGGDAVLAFYMTYYAQPMRFFLTHG